MDTLEIVPLIVIVEDTPEIGRLIGDLLELELRALTMHVLNRTQALEVLQSVRPALLILDDQLSGTSGVELYDWMRAQHLLAGVPVLWIPENPRAAEFRHRQFTSVLPKPFALDRLVQMVQRLLNAGDRI